MSFGEGNRNLFRYAVFNESYQRAFNRIPRERKFDIHYDELPGALVDLMGFLELADQGKWEVGQSAMAAVAERCSWLSQITDEFQNRDEEKRRRLPPATVARLRMLMKIARPLRPLLGPMRSYFDNRSLALYRRQANEMLAQRSEKVLR